MLDPSTPIVVHIFLGGEETKKETTIIYPFDRLSFITQASAPSEPAGLLPHCLLPHLDLRLLPARGWLINGHLDGLLIVGHYDGAQRAVLRVHLCVIHGPEPVELQVFQVPAEWPGDTPLSALGDPPTLFPSPPLSIYPLCRIPPKGTSCTSQIGTFDNFLLSGRKVFCNKI